MVAACSSTDAVPLSGPTNLCLLGNRFKVESLWVDFQGNAGPRAPLTVEVAAGDRGQLPALLSTLMAVTNHLGGPPMREVARRRHLAPDSRGTWRRPSVESGGVFDAPNVVGQTGRLRVA